MAALDLTLLLARLDPVGRQLLALRYLLYMKSEEIGEHLGLSAAGVRSRLRRLLADMRKDLLNE